MVLCRVWGSDGVSLGDCGCSSKILTTKAQSNQSSQWNCSLSILASAKY